MVTHCSLWSSLLSHGEWTTQTAEAHYNPFCEKGSCLLHSPSFPQQHIQHCWQPLKEKTFKSCSIIIINGDTERQLRYRGKSTKYGVRRFSWVQSQPLPLLVWPGTSHFYFSHVKVPNIIQRTNRLLSKCLLIRVCLQLCAKHYGKGPQRCVEISKAQCASKELTTWWWVQAHSPKLPCSLFSIKGWCRRKTLLNTCHLLSLRRRKWTIMTMTFRPILLSKASPYLDLSPDLFPMQEAFRYQPNVSAASGIPSLIGNISKWV